MVLSENHRATQDSIIESHGHTGIKGWGFGPGGVWGLCFRVFGFGFVGEGLGFWIGDLV